MRTPGRSRGRLGASRGGSQPAVGHLNTMIFALCTRWLRAWARWLIPAFEALALAGAAAWPGPWGVWPGPWGVWGAEAGLRPDFQSDG